MTLADLHERGDWWNFERVSRWDPTHPAAAWTAHLLQEGALTPLPCPRCGVVASVGANLNHLLRDHNAGYAEAATWLEEADADTFARPSGMVPNAFCLTARFGRQPALCPDLGRLRGVAHVA